MADFSSRDCNPEILEKLQSKNEDLSVRIKTASFLFFTSSVPHACKEETILYWLADTIVSTETVHYKVDAITALSNCINSTRLSNSCTELKPSLKDSITKAVTLFSEETNGDVQRAARECITSILISPVCRNSFPLDHDRLSEIVHSYSSCNIDCSPEELEKFIVNLLDTCKLNFFKEDFRLAFVNKMLMGIFKAFCCVCSEPTNTTRIEIIKGIEELAIKESCLTEKFLEYCTMENENSNTVTGSLATILKKMPLNESLKVVNAAYCIFFEAFCNFNKQSYDQVFKIFTHLCRYLGIKVKGQVSIEVEPVKEWSKEWSFLVISNVISVMHRTNIPCNCSLDNETDLTVWLSSMIIGVTNIHCGDLSPELLKLLSASFSFNPLIIENCNQPICSVMLEPKVNNEIRMEYNKFLVIVLNESLKIGRLQKFFSKFLERALDSLQFRTSSDLTSLDVFPTEIENHFCEVVCQLPSGQVLSSVKTFQYHLMYFLKNLNHRQEIELIIGLEIIVEMLSLFIKGVKITDRSTPVLVKDKFSSIIEDIDSCLSLFVDIIMEHNKNERLLISFFTLCHAIGSFRLFTWEYDSRQNQPLTPIDFEPTNLSYIHNCLDHFSWAALSKITESSSSTRLKNIFYALMLQKMEAVSQIEEGDEGPGTQVARYLLQHASTDWHWDNALKLLPRVEDQELLVLSDILVRSAGRDHTKWIPIISSDVFIHNRRLILVTTIAMLDLIAKHINKNCKYGAVSHRVISKIYVAIAPLLENNLARYYPNNASSDNAFLEMEIKTFIEDMCRELSDYLLSTPSSAPPQNEDFGIGGYIEVISQIQYEDLSYPQMEECVLLAMISLLCDIPLGTNKDDLLLDKINLILGIRSLDEELILVNIHLGALFNFLVNRSANYKGQKGLIYRFARYTLSCKNTFSGNACLIIKYVKSPTRLTLWQTTAVIKALAHALKVRNNSNRDEFKKRLPQLGNIGIKVIRSEIPSLDLLEDYTILLEHCYLKSAAGGDDDSDDITQDQSPLPLLQQYCEIAIDNYLVGKPLLKLVLKKWSFLSQFFSDDFLMKFWNQVIVKRKNVKADNLHLLFPCCSPEDLKSVLNDLVELTAGDADSDTETLFSSYERCCKIWEALVCSELTGECVKLRISNLLPLLKKLTWLFSTFSNIPNSLILSCLHLLFEIGQQTLIILSSQMVDHIFVILGKVPFYGPSSLDVISSMLGVLHSLHKYRKDSIIDKYPAYLQRMMIISDTIAEVASPDVDLSLLPEVEESCLKLVKLVQVMVKNQKEFRRIAPSLISRILNIFKIHTLHSEIKVHFVNILNVFFALCDEHSTSYLSIVLEPSLQELYKTYNEEYLKYHKYSGKI